PFLVNFDAPEHPLEQASCQHSLKELILKKPLREGEREYPGSRDVEELKWWFWSKQGTEAMEPIATTNRSK
ncbi:hypothetical protein H0H81_010273, partial [Sphagnurus paluster]